MDANGNLTGEALLQESELRSLRRPSKQTHKAFRDYFMNVDSPFGPYPTLLGNSKSLYDSRQDLVALGRHVDEDPLSQFFRRHLSIPFMVNALTAIAHYKIITSI